MQLSQDTRAQFDSDSGHIFQAALADYMNRLTDPRDPIRVVQMFNLVGAANKLPMGDYVEFGTHLGLSLKLIHRFMDQACQLYSFDTFEGFDARDVDMEAAKGYPHWKPGNFSPTSTDVVAEYLENPTNLHFIRGWMPEAYVGYETKRWRFAHLDMDLYAPTIATLRLVWPCMVPGGFVVIHDYGDSGFATDQAVDEFCAQQGTFPVELADHWSSAVIRKGPL